MDLEISPVTDKCIELKDPLSDLNKLLANSNSLSFLQEKPKPYNWDPFVPVTSFFDAIVDNMNQSIVVREFKPDDSLSI